MLVCKVLRVLWERNNLFWDKESSVILKIESYKMKQRSWYSREISHKNIFSHLSFHRKSAHIRDYLFNAKYPCSIIPIQNSLVRNQISHRKKRQTKILKLKTRRGNHVVAEIHSWNKHTYNNQSRNFK